MPLLKFLNNNEIEAGCDEAGRGCLAGPVVASAVILPNDFYHPLLNDSKQLNCKQRNLLRKVIECEAISYAVAMVDNEEIDKINILKASIKAMHLAVEQLETTPTFLLIDGNHFIKYKDVPHQCIIKGDAKFQSIAAASILAKTYRDDFMEKMHEKFPNYGWLQNKGYPTLFHRKGIEKYGITSLHRKSFKLIDKQLKIDLFSTE